MVAEGRTALKLVVMGDHPMLLQPFVHWLSRDCAISSTVIDLRVAKPLTQCERIDPNVVVVDQQAANGSVAAIVDELKAVLPSAKVLLLASKSDAEALRAAADAGCEGLVSKDQPPEAFVSAVLAAHGVQVAEVDVDTSTPKIVHLTGRERQVLKLLSEGFSTVQLCRELKIANNTARAHVQHVIEKLGAHSKLEAVAIARRSGLL